jgi:hypothetical protein
MPATIASGHGLRDFNGMPNWHLPRLRKAASKGGEPADKIGCVRDFRLRKRRPYPRKAARLSDYDMFLHLLHPGIPDGGRELRRHAAADPVTDGDQTFVE